MPASLTQILASAIDRNTAATVLLPSAIAGQAFRSRLLRHEAGTLWLESIDGQSAALDALIATAEPIKIELLAQGQKLEFATPLTHRHDALPLNDTQRVAAMGLKYPEHIQAIQRRHDYRVPVPGQSEANFRFWLIGPNTPLGAAPDDAMELKIDVRDFSAGGIGGIWKHRKNGPSSVVAGQRLRVLAARGGEALLLDSRLSFTVSTDGDDRRHIGLQFVFDLNDFAERQKLAKLAHFVGALERDQLRRLKVAR